MATELYAPQEDHGTVRIPLDPFGYLPGVVSKIAGLGGTASCHDPDYVFHTPYVEVGQGEARFTVRFRGLVAKQGTLVLRIHMVLPQESAHARLVTSDRILLSRLVQLNSETSIKFDGFNGVIFALYGGIPGNTDAIAESVEIVVDRQTPSDALPEESVDIVGTVYSAKSVKPVAHLVSLDRPTLASPVSQICTPAQLVEPVFQKLVDRLGLHDADPMDQWRDAFVLQALQRYGMLENGARGLGLGVHGSAVPTEVVNHGGSLLLLDNSAEEEALAASHRVESFDAARFDQSVSFRQASFPQLARDLVNFDFLWTNKVVSRLDTIASGLRFIERTMFCLRPGGIGVHTMLFTAHPEYAYPDSHTSVFQRGDLERLALILISREHEVAQIKLEGSFPADGSAGKKHGHSPISACGLIVRKAPSIV